MIQVIVNNFQSIEEAKFKVEGLTLIVGESCQGKSACLRALQSACTNRFKAGQVKFGEDHATIRVKVPESNSVLTVIRSWNGGSPTIKLGEKTFSKLGRTLPKEVNEFLNLGSIDFNGEVYSCNFHSQFQKPLLLEYSQQKVMELLSASSALDDLKETKGVLLLERNKNKGAISAVDSILKQTSAEIFTLKEKLSLIEPICISFNSYTEDLQSVEDRISKCESILNNVADLKTLSLQQDLLESILECKANYDDNIRDVNQVSILISKLEELNNLLNKEVILEDIIASYDEEIYSRINKLNLIVDLLSEIDSLDSKEEELKKLVELLEQHKEVTDKIKDLGIKRYQLSELSSNLSSLSILSDKELSLKAIVEDNICPICGNKVK